jgi:hypothetical protein
VRITSLLAACAIVLAGCSDSTSPDDSTFSFTYTGAGAANATTYSATGTIPAGLSQSNTFGTSPWAAGGVEATSNYSFIAGVIPKTSTSWDFAAVGIGRKTVGTSPIDPNCDVEATVDCTGVAIFFGFQPDGDGSFQYACFLSTGSATITSISETRIAGSFSGTGSCVNSLDVESSFTITGGAFDVAISPQLTSAGPVVR